MYKKVGKNTIVLLGVGHTNAHVLRMWRMKPIPNAELICVSDFPVATYSGMLPAVLAGQCSVADMEIDLVRLCNASGARLVVGNVTGIDRVQNRLLFSDRPPLHFSLLSIGVGSRPTFEGVDVAETNDLVPVKPMQTFLTRLEVGLQRLDSLNRPGRIAVVGGGVASVEVACCLCQRLERRGKNNIEISILTGSQKVASESLGSTQKKIETFFSNNGIEQVTGARVAAITESGIRLNDDREFEFDMIIWSTGAVAGPLLQQFDGFEKDTRGFLLTKPTLQTLDHQDIFAVGDSGTLNDDPTPKAGVYAVRQGPVLWENIKRKLVSRPLRTYQPQRSFLKLINFGNGIAAAEYKGFSFQGRWCWKLKNRIDTKFMSMYQDYEPMEMAASSDDDDDTAMRCLGCGGKIGGELLGQVLSELEIPDHPDVVVGLKNPDDAAVVRTHDNMVTVTTDFFAAPFDDPYLVGRIATLNSASDCFVMGAQPTSALAIVQLPLGHPRGQLQVMRELMAGSVEELNRMGATIVGGHTIEGPRTMIGYTILGRQLTDLKIKGALQPGDQLVLTKAIGTGVLLAGLMDSKLGGYDYQQLVGSMLQSNQVALELVQRFPVSALTDVTGFGLIGHLAEVLVASCVSARIFNSKIPLLSGCVELIQEGIESTLTPANRQTANKVEITSELDLEAPEMTPLFDPQTGGGLLFGIGKADVGAALDFLRVQGFEQAVVVGEVTDRGPVKLTIEG